MISPGPSVLKLANFVNGNPFKPADLGDEGLPVIRIRQLLDSTAATERAIPPDRPVTIERGDLIFSWSATLAVRHWYGGRALLNQHLFRVDPVPGVDGRWLGYALEVGVEYLRPLMHGSAMTHITLDMLRSLTVSVPEISPQRAIADYLDIETGRIDALISKKRRMIDVLAERRQALVTAAVQPQQDDRRAIRMKHVSTIVTSNVDKLTIEYERPVRLVNYTDVYYRDRLTRDLPLMQATVSDSELAKFRLVAGDVLITKDSETADDIGVASYVESSADDMVCGYHLSRIRAEAPIADGRYLFWVLVGSHARDQMSNAATGVTRFGLRADSIRNLVIRVPSLQEQRAIADYLDGETGRLDTVIDVTRHVIDLFLERRQALITGAVTGELAVPRLVA